MQQKAGRKKYLGLIFITVSGIIAFIIAMSNPRANKMEMDAMYLAYGPIVSSIILIILYFPAVWLKINWKWVTVVFCIINLVVGVYLFRFHE